MGNARGVKRDFGALERRRFEAFKRKRLSNVSNPPVIPGDLMLKLVHERKAGGSSGTVAQPCGSGSIGRRVRSERAHATGVLYEARVVIGNAGSVSETTAAAG